MKTFFVAALFHRQLDRQSSLCNYTRNLYHLMKSRNDRKTITGIFFDCFAASLVAQDKRAPPRKASWRRALRREARYPSQSVAQARAGPGRARNVILLQAALSFRVLQAR
jgi:hypothetical protein